MLDEFIWGKVRRISPEAPVPVVEVARESISPGRRRQRCRQYQRAGSRSRSRGARRRRLCRGALVEAAVETRRSNLRDWFPKPDRPTTVKTRIVAHNQQIVRADRENKTPLTEERNSGPAGGLRQVAAVVCGGDRFRLRQGRRESATPVAGLPAAQARGRSRAARPEGLSRGLLSPHHPDHAESARSGTADGHVDRKRQAQLEAAGRQLLEKFECPYALITRGEEGMSLFSQGGSASSADVRARGFRCQRAQETRSSRRWLWRSRQEPTWKSPRSWPIIAAGLVVGKVGTATISRTELLADFASRNAHSSS